MVDEFNASISFDQRMAVYDIKGSIAHVRMLGKQGIIAPQEATDIENGLECVLSEVMAGSFQFKTEDEDVHMAVEKRLTEIVGAVGGKLHTARSRNDQVAVDFRMYMRNGIASVNNAIIDLEKVIIKLAETNDKAIMPGYTHLQVAQPILYSHYIMAYFQMFSRDFQRFSNILTSMNYCPLGAGALAGTTFPIDRHYVAQELGFIAPTQNSIDSVSDRDFAIEFLSAASICMMHLSKFSEELIIHSTSEFSFVELSDGFCTGSSIMPQKKNPDIPELIRGKTGRVYGDLMGLLTVMKGLPLAYNKDMQEDKEGVFDALDTLLQSLRIFAAMLSKIKIRDDNMLRAALNGYSTATDVADYLVRKNLPFRQAHHVTGSAVNYAIKKGVPLQQLSLEEFREFSELFTEDIFQAISVETSVNNRNSFGGTSHESVQTQIKAAKLFIESVQ
jgi:argininosuccinate lyase